MAEQYDIEPDSIDQFKAWFKVDIEKAKVWRKEAEEDFRFRDGDQWNEEEKRILLDQERPVLVFNRTGVLVDAVVGSEIGNRREVRFIPREMADAKANEVLTSAAEWFRDLCDAEDEESEAFKDTVTAGMGWTETRLDYDDNPAGEPKIDHIDPFEMVWDADAVKANLVDSERRWRVRKFDCEVAKGMFPDADESELNASWADTDEDDDEPNRSDPATRYSGLDEDYEGAKPKKVTIVACQYYKRETYYRVLMMDPETMQPTQTDLDEEKFKIASEMGAIIKSVKLTRKRVHQVFLGKTILKKAEPTQTGAWTWNCITGLRDQQKGIFYGIVRRAKDPQRWANKWLSQMMHILNSQAKGGIMAEESAFTDQRAAEESWARTDRITWLAKGALSGQGAKVQPKPAGQFPAGFDRLLQYADDAIIKSTGINMELLGMRDANQPGILEAQRKQSGITILASLFDSLRRYRKIQGRGLLRLIQDFLSDGRLVRIVGEEREQYVPLTKAEVADVEYDIIVDDSPSAPNEKERTWAMLTQILPMFKDMIGPQEIMLLAEYSPLPSSLVEKLKGMGEKKQQGLPPEVQQAVQAGMQKIKELEAELEQAKADQSAKYAEIASDEAVHMAEIAAKERMAAADRESELRVALIRASQQPQTIGQQ